MKIKRTLKGKVKITLNEKQFEHLRQIVGDSEGSPEVEKTSWKLYNLFLRFTA